jgi:5-methylcytosine-specific restriction endonuclease McrA
VPHAPAYACNFPGCPHRVPCPIHGRAVEDRGFYATRVWRRIATAQLLREPWCRHCLMEGLGLVRAVVADHVTPRREGGSDLPRNLQSLCRLHDARKRASESRRAR